MFAGCLWLRIAERQLTGLLWNDPPRNTRDLTTGHPCPGRALARAAVRWNGQAKLEHSNCPTTRNHHPRAGDSSLASPSAARLKKFAVACGDGGARRDRPAHTSSQACAPPPLRLRPSLSSTLEFNPTSSGKAEKEEKENKEREQGPRLRVYLALAARKPLRLSMPAGRLRSRTAERQSTGSPWNDPPRNTRDLSTAPGASAGLRRATCSY